MEYVNIENDLDIVDVDIDTDTELNNTSNNMNNKKKNNYDKEFEEQYFYKNPHQANVIKLIIKIANNVFNILGKGFVESIYHKAILVDLYNTCYSIETKKIIPIMYKNINVGYVESDIIVYDIVHNVTVIIELKSQEKDLNNKEIIQVQKYMKNIENKNSIGLVINFPQKNNNDYIVQSKIAYPLLI